jgi:hypothetical protein
VLGNTIAAIQIVNTDTTASNTAGLHFSRADTDDTPNYAGASIVAQFGETQATGQYPSASMSFLTSSSQNAAPSLKMTLTAAGLLGIGVVPSHPLQVAAGADTDAMYLDVNGNFFITDGNVQITNPSGADQAALVVTQNHATALAATFTKGVSVTGHASVGANVVASTRALTVVGATDGTGSSIIVGYNSSLASKFSVRDDGYTAIAGGLAVTGAATVSAEGGSATTNVSLGLCKAWIRTSGAAVSIADSFNMTSITDSGVGLYAPVIANNMNDGNYALILGADDKQDGAGIFVHTAQDAVSQATTGYATSFKKLSVSAYSLADANQNAASSVLGDLA